MRTIFWRDGTIDILDQTQLPGREARVSISTVSELAEAIAMLRVRGAPLLGVAGAYGMALSARNRQDEADYMTQIARDAETLRRTRPTAVNLFVGIDQAFAAIETAYAAHGGKAAAEAALLCAEKMRMDGERIDTMIGQNGATLVNDGSGVLTHCNAGSLATTGIGTALGIIYTAWESGKLFRVYADETRPLLQGARLTAWELTQRGIPVTLLCDNMAGECMRQGKIQLVLVGADRIAANGDTANKIGTYSLAQLARAHKIPFYVAAPESTIDRTLSAGKDIEIEERGAGEVRTFAGTTIAPENVDVFNPAFDVTPARLITGIITEKMVYKPGGTGEYTL